MKEEDSTDNEALDVPGNLVNDMVKNLINDMAENLICRCVLETWRNQARISHVGAKPT